MSRKWTPATIGALLLCLGVGVVWIWHRVDWPYQPKAAVPAAKSPLPSPPPIPSPPLSKEARRKLLADIPEARLADNLNDPNGSIQSDMAVLASLFAAYRSIYTGQGNPIGDNREITDTFLGNGLNRSHIPFLTAGHRAINERGELCDRWGTPMLFHAESGTKMEIRSAGPDRIPRTADDVWIVP